MNLLPTRNPAADAAEPTPVVTIRPARAAFGPHVSLVSVDNHGRLWVRFSTALALLVAGIVLMLIPLCALWFAGGGLVKSGQIELDPRTSHGIPSTSQPTNPTSSLHTTGGGPSGSPTELPLAQGDAGR